MIYTSIVRYARNTSTQGLSTTVDGQDRVEHDRYLIEKRLQHLELMRKDNSKTFSVRIMALEARQSQTAVLTKSMEKIAKVCSRNTIARLTAVVGMAVLFAGSTVTVAMSEHVLPPGANKA